MNRIDTKKTGLASLGRDEDQFLAHVALGERVVPPVISASTQARINQEMRAAGLDPNEYSVGSGMSINPITGLPEFGFFKKAFKSLKKVAKKVAPIAMLVPGVGTALGGMLGGLGGGLGSLVSSIPGAAKIGKFFNPIKGATGIFGGTIGPSIRKGIGGLFSGGMGGGASEYTPMSDTMDGPITGYMNADGNVISVDQYNQMVSRSGGTNPFIKSIGDAFGFGGRSAELEKYGYTHEQIQAMTDQQKAEAIAKGRQSGARTMPGVLGNVFGGGGSGGGMGGLGGLGVMGLLGKAVYDDTKSRAGGLAQTPQVMMDQLGRYQLSKELGTGGTRGEFGLAPKPAVLNVANGGPIDNRMYYATGGVAELDMRDGGESEGPGTGTSDDIPAMLSDGEFVMTAAATKGAGAFDVNKTKSGIELISGGKASREKGVENMRELMNIFEAI